MMTRRAKSYAADSATKKRRRESRFGSALGTVCGKRQVGLLVAGVGPR